MPFAEFGVKIQNGKTTYFKRILYDISQEERVIANYRNRYHNTDIFRSIFTYSVSDFSQALIQGPLYFDFDCNDRTEKNIRSVTTQVQHCVITLQQYLKIPASQIYVYFSGNKGFHVIVPHEVLNLGFCDSAVLLRHYNLIASIIKQEWETRYETQSYLDTKIYDHRRMFRLPNSFNRKGERYKILLPNDDYRLLSYFTILDMSKEPSPFTEQVTEFCYAAQQNWIGLVNEDTSKKQEQTNSNNDNKGNCNRFIKKKGNILPCVRNIASTSISKGRRNNVAIVLASALLQCNYKLDIVQEILVEWNSHNKPPLSDPELHSTIKSAYTLYQQDKGYGCTSVRQLGFCSKQCEIQKEVAK